MWRWLLGLVLLVAAAPGGASTTDGPELREETTVLTVEVPVQVVLRGEAVAGLGPADFRLFDEGREQAILGFEVVAAHSPAEAPVASAGPGEADPGLATGPRRRHFFLLFDLAWGSSRAHVAAVHAAQRLVRDELAPGDEVAVAFFSGLRGFVWLDGFGSSRRDDLAALAVMEAVAASRPVEAARRLAAWGPPAIRQPPGARREEREILAEAGISGVNRNAPWSHASVFERLAKALQEAAWETADLAGPKYLVHFTSGLPDSHVSGASPERARVLDDVQRIVRTFRKTGWSIQSVNLAGLGWGRDSLLLLAHDSGGQLFTNSNDLLDLVGEVEASTRISYLLAFQPQVAPDGSYHRLEVELVGGPRGARVVHRPGYYAPEGRR